MGLADKHAASDRTASHAGVENHLSNQLCLQGFGTVWTTSCACRIQDHLSNHLCLQEFRTIWHSWLTMFNFMVSGFEFGIFYECHNPEAAIILVVLYMFVVAVIFLNLLVGVMTDSWSKVTPVAAILHRHLFHV